MKKLYNHPVLMLVLGVILGAGTMLLTPQQKVAASAAAGNDKFSMCTVPVATIAETDAVFVLDHLTGILRGGYLNSGTGAFTHTYLRNVAADFQLNPSTPEPRYCIVAGPANLRSGGGNQPANGVLYIGELTSGAVIAYGFGRPQGRGSVAPMEVVRIDGFAFREAAGG
ncbi:MAG: hypothetical protein KDA81_04315 [Planctomycetaceae bacterium]|nr:hypothetical protein [Planctomycetaceae bacterium]